MMEMGHGDTTCIRQTATTPQAATAKRLVRLDGHGVCEILDAMLRFFPLDTYVEEPVTLMSVVPGDEVKPTIWDDYRAIVKKHQSDARIGFVERFAFYDLARDAYAVVATGETALYANVLLKKGVVK